MFFKKKNGSPPPAGAAKKGGASHGDVLRALATVTDPEQQKDIVALGYIKGVQVQGDAVGVQLQPKTQNAQSLSQIKTQIEQRLRDLSGVEKVYVALPNQGGHSHGHSHSQGRSSQAGPSRISLPNIKQLIAVASGKGGVGKSTVAVNLSMALAKNAKVGLLDADIYGPSIPLMMGVSGRPTPSEDGSKLIPKEKGGVKLMSMGFLASSDKPVIWRGPMVHGALVQFLTQVDWGELDYLLVDMPPGTGDAQLTMSQTAPVTGAVIVTTPQDVSLIDARKGLAMFESVQVPILGVIENMAGYVCSHCGEETAIFRSGGGTKIAEENEVDLLGKIPIDPTVSAGGDSGEPVVLSAPTSAAGKAFLEIGDQVQAKLTQASHQPQFQAQSLQWQ